MISVSLSCVLIGQDCEHSRINDSLSGSEIKANEIDSGIESTDINQILQQRIDSFGLSQIKRLKAGIGIVGDPDIKFLQWADTVGNRPRITGRRGNHPVGTGIRDRNPEIKRMFDQRKGGLQPRGTGVTQDRL